MKMWNSIKSFLATIFGHFSWRCPPWLTTLLYYIGTYPRRFLGILTLIIAILGIGGYTYHWYTHLPKPLLITAHITQPATTPNEKELIPQPLIINFGMEDDEFTQKSVAPLDAIGQEVKSGIHLSPEIEGSWAWENDHRLVFTPTQAWPAGEKYAVDFDKSVFASHVKLDNYHYTFSTRPFRVKIASYRFYQDPVNVNQRQAVATITFNYPVDTESFVNNVALTLQGFNDGKLNFPAKDYKFTIDYDENKRTAYLHSENLTLSDVQRYLALTINPGVKSITGPSELEKKIQQDIIIPDIGSYFKVINTSTAIVHNKEDKPEQVLNIETSVGVQQSELDKSIHVYLLPQDRPATVSEEAKPNYQWQSFNEVTPNILAKSTPLDLQAIPADRDYATLHSYRFDAPSSRYIYVKLDQGTKAFGDYVLTHDFATILTAPEFPKEIGFLHKGALLALDSEKKLSIVVRGLPAIKVSIARVLPDDVNQLVTQTNGTFANPTFINDSFNQNNISEIFSEIRTFDNSDPAKAQYIALDVGKYLSSKLNANGPQGLFMLHVTGWDPTQNQTIDVNADRLILVTNLGFIVKDNYDGSHDVFVQSITTGKPAAGVKISVLGKNGLAFLSQLTDAQGHVNFPTLKDYVDDHEPTAYLATQGADVAFIPYQKTDRQLNYSRFNTGGIYSQPDQQNLSAYVFSDRGIYRPGDTAHIGMIVKQAYVGAAIAGLPLEAIITDPRGMTVLDQKISLDESGFLTLDFPTRDAFYTGNYAVNLYIVKDDHASNLLGSTTIRVAEFLPDRMRIAANFSTPTTEGWISPADLDVTVNLQNLYGTPATARDVKANINLAPEAVKFASYPDYHFVDPLYDTKNPPEVLNDTLPEQQTDSQGNATFDLNLQRFAKATYKLTFFAEGFEAAGGRSVTTQTSTLVSPLAYLVGYKADGDLNFIKQNTARSIRLIAVNPQLKQIALSNLKLQLIALRPVTTLVKNPDGTYQYQSLIQTNVLSTTPFNINEQGTTFPLTATTIGDFAVRVIDQNGVELSRFNYSIVGASQSPLAKNAELSVKLDKTQYHPGETIQLQITSPYTGAGLITIERDKVYASQWFTATSTTSLQTITLPANFQGNGYVNVTFVRDWNSPDIFLNPLSYSVVPFSIDDEAQTIHISLSAPATSLPGQPITVQYQTNQPSKIILYGIDEGILQVANYTTPDPLSFFFQKRALEVTTQQTVDQILPKFMLDRELSAVGGDGSEEALPMLLNPFKRKTDLPVVFWSGILDADTTPRQYTYNVPDYFNGSLRIMAVAVAATAVGATDTTSQVRGDFVISPNVPTFAAPGDEFEVSANIANNLKNSGAKVPVNITLQVSPGLQIIGPSKQTLNIDEGHEQSLTYKLKATSVLGSAKMTFTASANNKSSELSATLSVRPAAPYKTTMMSGMSQAASQSFNLDRDLYAEKRIVNANISNNPLMLVFGLQQYLDNFPYGCTEQLVSKVLPLLAMNNQSAYADQTTKIAQKIQATIQMLAERQMSNGGFSYWPNVGDYASNTFASIYAMQFLTQANAQGFEVPRSMLDAGLGYLKTVASQTPSNLQDARLVAYAIYILTRNEIVTTNYLTNLQMFLDQDKQNKWHNDITSAYVASTYALLKSQSDADRLIRYYDPKDKSVDEATDFYNKQIGNAQYLYLLAQHFPNILSHVSENLVLSLVQAMNSDEINTVLSGYISLAFNAYAQVTTPPAANNLLLRETLKSGENKLISTDNFYHPAYVDLLAQKISVENPSKQPYFYQIVQSGFDKTAATTTTQQGLEIDREFRDTKGNKIDHINLGEEIEVHIHLRSIDDRYYNNIAIVDLLPGGFEVVNGSISDSDFDYADVREDRIIFFGYANADAKEITYRIKAVNKGTYQVPPILASSMYDPHVQAQGVSGSFVVS